MGGYTGPCIEGPGFKDRQGYTFLTVDGRKRRAHRHSYCIANAVSHDAIAHLVVRHKCDNPSCINPNHLEIGTRADNSRDMAERGRSLHGERSLKAKLTEEQVAWVRANYKFRHPVHGQTAMASTLGVTKMAIHEIIKGRNWKHGLKPASGTA